MLMRRRAIPLLIVLLLLISGCQKAAAPDAVSANTPVLRATAATQQVDGSPTHTPAAQTEATASSPNTAHETPSSSPPTATPATTTIPTETSIATPSPYLSPTLQRLSPIYQETARANIRDIGGHLAVVPSPVYANGIYARDAFYTSLGLGDPELFEQAYRWFEDAQNPQTGQITTAIAFDPADHSLQPQDDEGTLIFLIWSGLLQRAGYETDPEVIDRALEFVQNHVRDDRYVSAPGIFRYWADCWEVTEAEVITYNQGLYALALRFLVELEHPGVSQEMVERATEGYRERYRPELGIITQGLLGPGATMQDGSALLPEFLHRLFFDEGMLADADVLTTVDTRLATASVYDHTGQLVGIKIIADADGSFAYPGLFDCPTMRNPGDYHNGGNWPLWTNIELALAHSISPKPAYRQALETLVERELADGSPKEYWELQEGRVGVASLGRDVHAWNVLIVPALRMAGLVE